MNFEIRNILTFNGTNVVARFIVTDGAGYFYGEFERGDPNYGWRCTFRQAIVDAEIMHDVLAYGLKYARGL